MFTGEFLDSNGIIIGNDGINDGRVYVLKTSETVFEEGGYSVPGAGISKSELKATVNFIKSNSGNTAAFQSNSIAYDNSIEIEGAEHVRLGMVNIVKQDNGTGLAKDDSNSIEYGGYLEHVGLGSPIVRSVPPGVSEQGENAHITLPNGYDTFHSHPSADGKNGKGPYAQIPSEADISSMKVTTYRTNDQSLVTNAKNHIGYVFGRRNGMVYIYNSQGVQATLPMSKFENFR